MSKMKKIFVVIACVMMVAIASFIITINKVKSNVYICIDDVYDVVVFDHSSTGKSLSAEAKVDFYNQIKEITNVSVYEKLVNGVSLTKNIHVDDEDKYVKWTSDMKNNNYVIELTYDTMHDLVVYQGKYTRVISYFSLAFVIPKTEGFTDIAVYYSLTNETTERENDYKNYAPVVLYGNASEFVKFIEKAK